MRKDNNYLKKLALKKLAKKHGLKLVLVFGSYVSKKAHPMSDIDIGVLSHKNQIEWKRYTSLIQELKEIFPGKKIDLAILDHADPLFLKKVMESARLLYGERREFEDLRLHSFHNYQDYKKYLLLEEDFVHTFLKTLT